MPDFNEILAAKNIKKLYPYQEKCIENLKENKSVFVCTPTASGKTLIAEYGIVKALNEGKKAIYVVPMRALAHEKYEELKIYQNFGYKVVLQVGDMDASKYRSLNFDILIATAEKLDSILRSDIELKNIGFLVIDEVHFIGTDRGPVYEILIARIKKQFPKIQILALSATIGNADEVSDWLNAELIKSDFRPVKITEEVCTDELEDVVSKKIDAGGILIFVNSKKRAEDVAKKLSKKFSFKTEIGDEITDAVETPTEQCVLLSELVKRGIAFHHAGLVEKQRALIEEYFKKRVIKIITATPTLAYGVNLPSHTVIIHDIKRFGDRGMKYIPVMEYKQMIGRAGRPKYDILGEAIIISNKKDKEEIVDRYINGKVEDIHSYLMVEPVLRFHTLSLIPYTESEEEVIKFFESTFSGYKYGNIKKFKKEISSIIDQLTEWKFINNSNGNLTLTRLGRRVSELYIDPFTAHNYITLLNKNPETTIKILTILCNATEMPYISIKRDEEETLMAEIIEKEIETDDLGNNYLETFKTAKIFEDWINERTEKYLYNQYSIAPGLLHQRVEILQWLSYAASEISKILNLSVREKIKNIEIRIKYGIREELLNLVEVRGIGRIRARKLYNAGYTNAESLRHASVEELSKIIGRKIAENIKKEVEII